jgi:hypothetical protein
MACWRELPGDPQFEEKNQEMFEDKMPKISNLQHLKSLTLGKAFVFVSCFRLCFSML